MDRKKLLLVAIFFEGGLFLFGLLLMGGLGAVQGKLKLSWDATAYALLLSIPMFASLYFAVRSTWGPLSRLKKEVDEKIVPLFANCTVFDLAVIALLAGTGEELFFRGWLQTLLAGKYGVIWGILTASLIFGVAHYLSTAYAVYAGLTGVYLGYVFILSGNLYIVMVMHTVYDFFTLLYLIKRGNPIKLNFGRRDKLD